MGRRSLWKPGHRFTRSARTFIVAGVVAIVLWTIVLMVFEERFIYFPSAFPDGPYESIAALPGAREMTVRTEDGVSLHAVYAPAESSTTTVIFAHGNAGNLSHRIDFVRRMQAAGVSMFVFDYRGYGKSEGHPQEEGVYRDVCAAYDHVRDSLGVAPGSIVGWGRSLGGAVAVELAARREVAALILESTFTSAADVAAEAYPFLPFLGRLMKTNFDSARKLRSLHTPSLHIHGRHDAVISLTLGRRLFDAAAGPKEFYLVEDAGHNDCYSVGGTEYLRRVTDFLSRTVHP